MLRLSPRRLALLLALPLALPLAPLSLGCASTRPASLAVPSPVAAPERAAAPGDSTRARAPRAAEESPRAAPERLTLESDGWRLVGEWTAPDTAPPHPAALLLHRAAGSRAEYVELAEQLRACGVASLRLDLRAHGESTNLGEFTEPYAEKQALLVDSERDVNVALAWLRQREDVDGDRLAVVAASYSGEAVGEALRAGGAEAAAYVMLSPGSFSDASIERIDRGAAEWLFVRTELEGPVSRPIIDELFEALRAGSTRARYRLLPGRGHATQIFTEHPEVVVELAAWIAARVGADACARDDVARARRVAVDR
ncbi:MAG: hypothetical protein H6713_33630 [Myxococcales bacterium]|nr:hypothetical protein [Myxococcales bacterium]